jgi:hypothetical protein
VFNDRRMFINHPRRSDEKDRPERDVRDWFATAKETTWDETRDIPRTRIKVYDDAAYERFKKAPDEIAFSIIGGGYARKGRVDGREAKVVEALDGVKSIDWVTQAGAGGAIFSESAHEELEMELRDLTKEQLLDELKSRGIKVSEADGESGDTAPGSGPATTGAPKTETTEQTSAATTTEKTTTTPAGDGGDAGAKGGEPAGGEPERIADMTLEQLVGAIAPRLVSAIGAEQAKVTEAERAATVRRTEAREAAGALIASSTLPKSAKQIIASRFTEADYGDDAAYKDVDALKKAVQHEITLTSRLLGIAPRSSSVTGLGAVPEDESGTSVRESVMEALFERIGPDDDPSDGADGGVKVVADVNADPEKVRESAPATMSEAGRDILDSLLEQTGDHAGAEFAAARRGNGTGTKNKE